ncbi:MAG: PorV/PorQ family protein [Elusimicrobia bacterium]|nr:PorV/PorQ family protein [Elusimicrobiota bacterium]
MIWAETPEKIRPAGALQSAAAGAFVFAILLAAPAQAGESGGQPGAFLQYGVGARALGMGGAFFAVADDATAAYWNPAGLAYLQRKELTTMQAALFAQTNYTYLGYAHPTTTKGTFALGITQLVSTGFEKVNAVFDPATGEPTSITKAGSFQDSQRAIALSWGREATETMSFGLSMKQIARQLDSSSDSTLALDIAAMRIMGPNYKLALGVQNVFSKTGGDTSDKFPVILKLGNSVTAFKERLILGFDLQKSQSADLNWRFGGEYWAARWFAFRFGLLAAPQIQETDFGFGLRFRRIQLDLAQGIHELGASTRMSVSFRFGRVDPDVGHLPLRPFPRGPLRGPDQGPHPAGLRGLPRRRLPAGHPAPEPGPGRGPQQQAGEGHARPPADRRRLRAPGAGRRGVPDLCAQGRHHLCGRPRHEGLGERAALRLQQEPEGREAAGPAEPGRARGRRQRADPPHRRARHLHLRRPEALRRPPGHLRRQVRPRRPPRAGHPGPRAGQRDRAGDHGLVLLPDGGEGQGQGRLEARPRDRPQEQGGRRVHQADPVGRMSPIGFFIILTAFGGPPARATEAGPPLSLVAQRGERIEAIRERVQREILDRLFGPGTMSAFVDGDVALETTRVEDRTFGEGAAEKNRFRAGSDRVLLRSRREVVPGVPEPVNIFGREPVAPPEAAQRHSAAQEKKDQKLTISERLVFKKLEVTVIHDAQVPHERIAQARKLIFEAVKRSDPGFRPEAVTFLPANYARPQKDWWGDLQRPQVYLKLLSAFLTLLFLAFLFGPLARFFRRYIEALSRKPAVEVSLESKSSLPDAAGKASEPVRSQVEMLVGRKPAEPAPPPPPPPPAEDEEGPLRNMPFTYVNEGNLASLANLFLLRAEEPWMVAVVLSYLRPEYGRRVLTSLPFELQAKVALEALKVRQVTREQLLAIDADIKESIDYVVGGIENLVRMLDDRVRRLILLFDDMALFPDREMQTIVRGLNTDRMAKALHGAPPGVTEKFFSNMSAGAASLVKEAMGFLQGLTTAQVEEERDAILEHVKSLEGQGRISVRGDAGNGGGIRQVFAAETVRETRPSLLTGPAAAGQRRYGSAIEV